MDRKRLTLDNPIFEGRLRYNNRSSAYVRRPTQHLTVSGMVDVVVPIAQTPVQPKPQPATQERITTIVPSPASKPIEAASLAPSVPSKPNVNFIAGLRSWRIQNKKAAALYAMATFLFAIGVLVSWNGLRTNHQVAAQVKQSQQTADSSADSSGPPSTVKPSASAVKNYAVAPNVPRYLDVPRLHIHTRVLSEGLTKKNELQVPWNIYDVGWYNASAQPGQNGAMLIDGHSGIGATHGVFYKLANLAAGDALTVTRGDGQRFTYEVVKTQTVNIKDVDMASMLVSADTSKPGLNLITCAGDQIAGTTELSKRVLVYATLQ